MRLHVRAPPGTRIEKTQEYFAQVEAAIRQIVGATRSTSILDNIGLPYSGINIALSDSATVGTHGRRDPDLTEGKAPPTAALVSAAAPRAAAAFPELQFFFQPADIVDQVLNFGQPAPIDIRVSGATAADLRARANVWRDTEARARDRRRACLSRFPDAPALTVDVDRALAPRSA